jgi:myosin heavy subunit
LFFLPSPHCLPSPHVLLLHFTKKSGESGSGKTEATKSIIACLAGLVSGGKGGGGGGGGGKTQLGRIETMIMETNPVLEAFGNARTVRNNNSSRFGKFVKVLFDGRGVIVGATIETYLLEKSRVVYQASSERNYHVFYQLCAGVTKEERQAMSLMSPSEYHYLKQGGCYSIPDVNDAAEFTRMRQALQVVSLVFQSCPPLS